MPSDIRSRSRQRLSAFFGRSSSKTREPEATAAPAEKGFEATGRNRLLKDRNGAATPTVAYPPSSFRGPTSEAEGFSRRMSWGSNTSATSRPLSANGDVVDGRETPSNTNGLSRTNSRPFSIASRASSRGSVNTKARPDSVYSIISQKSQLKKSRPDVNAVATTVPADKEKKKLKRKSWMPRSSKTKAALQDDTPIAWIAGDATKVPYEVGPLMAAQKVAELWDEGGGMALVLWSLMRGTYHSNRYTRLPLPSDVRQGPVLQSPLIIVFRLKTAREPCACSYGELTPWHGRRQEEESGH